MIKLFEPHFDECEKNEGGQRRIFGYDSFEGFPDPTIEDRAFRDPKKGDWSKSPNWEI